MNKRQWQYRIKTATERIGTYNKSFDHVINTLSDILVERDRIYKQYVDDGARPIIETTSDRGAKNKRPNPLLKEWNELNAAALGYWRDLGLTPAGLKKINDEAMKEKKVSALDSILSGLET